MINLCCTSDFDGDGLLSLSDYRLYGVWSLYVDKNQAVEQQIMQLDELYRLFYPLDAFGSVVAIPELDCADYEGNGLLSLPDYRLYALWSLYVDKEQTVEQQLITMDMLYTSFYPTDSITLSVRIPTILNPDNCAVQHGWFVTPWHSKVEIAFTKYGWLE